MFNRKILTSLVIAGGLGLAGMGSALAQPGDPMGPPPPPPGGMYGPEAGPLGKIFQNITLSADQQQKVQVILSNARANEISKRGELRSIHDSMINTLLAPGKVEKGNLDPLLDKQAKVEKELGADRAKTAVAIRNVLTPDQLVQVKARYIKLKGIAEQMRQLHGQANQTVTTGTATPSANNGAQ